LAQEAVGQGGLAVVNVGDDEMFLISIKIKKLTLVSRPGYAGGIKKITNKFIKPAAKVNWPLFYNPQAVNIKCFH